MNWKKIKALVLGILGTKNLPQKDGKINLSDEQRAELIKALKDEALLTKFEALANQQFANEAELTQLREQSQETATELATLLRENGIEATTTDPDPDEEEEEDEGGEGDAQANNGGKGGNKPKPKAGGKPNPDPGLNKKQIELLRAQLKKMNQQIETLSEDPETELAEIIKNNGNMNVAHSSTHLFATGNDWDAFENRPWNQRAAGQDVKPTASGYSKVEIDRVVEDFGDYFKQELEENVNFLRGIKRLPSFWGKLSNVQDEVWYTKLFIGEVTQARKKNWLAKGKFEYQPEKAKVYDSQIDLEFIGHELQKMEKTWMGKVNKEGASPFKMSFVMYLMEQVVKKRIEEDEIALIRGIYIPTPDDATEPGSFLHRNVGLLKNIRQAQIDRKYLPANIGKPTTSNIYDYMEAFVKSIPKYWRDLPGMVVYMDPDWEKAYHKRREELKGTMPTYEPGKMTVDQYENFRIEPLHFGMGDFMFATPDDNIDLLEGAPGEENTFEMERQKRNLAVYADYRLGVHVYAYGYKYPEGVEMTMDKQMFFSNNVPIVLNNYVPIDANATEPSAEHHYELQTGENTQATAITNITNVADGQTIYLYGNKGANPSTIANGGNFDLDGAITLSENVMIELYNRDGVFVEISRNENLKKPDFVVLDDGATTADASEGTRFVTSANSAPTAFTDIVNAEQDVVYRLEGGSDQNATTIAAEGKFSRITGAMVLGDGEWIDVKYNGSKFVELERNEIA